VNTLTLGVLLCDTVDPSRLHIEGDYPTIFTNRFREFTPAGFEVRLRFYDVTAGQYPDRLDECDGYLTNGAGASANDPDPWIARLADFFRHLHAEHAKLFAICFGHQIIAKALGGRVEKSTRGWGVGIHDIAVLHREPWMTPTADSFRVICSHQDQVVELPPDGVILASTAHCPVSMFRCGTLVGIQGHPEFSIAYAQALLDSRAEIIPADTRARATASFAIRPNHALLVSWIVRYLTPEGERPG
jgi:GMP synthase-like glutamine amidotransferase